ncbi:hypothetical protein HYH03_006906 [Edaphochlamys debaryana]|uniref:Uncharacterized protein n=1 Tax=Edaphochlamys debaryana TaxID=47281 RepID=A0A835Y2Z9_9CHLO|nr:hypothetical protein HYH03_006906 [Edaphochlamys debaryana]|eukprot:KAG2494973.1 hypothetical protein HYH03_006906 [Edaphochlamys debaryana]
MANGCVQPSSLETARSSSQLCRDHASADVPTCRASHQHRLRPHDVVQLAERRIRVGYRRCVLVARALALLGSAPLPLVHLGLLSAQSLHAKQLQQGAPALAFAGAGLAAASSMLLLLGAVLVALPARYCPIYSRNPVNVNVLVSAVHVASQLVAWAVHPGAPCLFVGLVLALLADLFVCLPRVSYDVTYTTYWRFASPYGSGTALLLPVSDAGAGKPGQQQPTTAPTAPARSRLGLGPDFEGSLGLRVVARCAAAQLQFASHQTDPDTGTPGLAAAARLLRSGPARPAEPSEWRGHVPGGGPAGLASREVSLASLNEAALAAASSSSAATSCAAPADAGCAAAAACGCSTTPPHSPLRRTAHSASFVSTPGSTATDSGPRPRAMPPVAAVAAARYSLDLSRVGGAGGGGGSALLTSPICASGLSTGGIPRVTRPSFELRSGPGAAGGLSESTSAPWAVESEAAAAAGWRRGGAATLAAVAEAAAETAASAAGSDAPLPMTRHCNGGGVGASSARSGRPSGDTAGGLPAGPCGLQEAWAQSEVFSDARSIASGPAGILEWEAASEAAGASGRLTPPRSPQSQQWPSLQTLFSQPAPAPSSGPYIMHGPASSARSEALPSPSARPWVASTVAAAAARAAADALAAVPVTATVTETGSAPLMRLGPGAGGGGSYCSGYVVRPSWRDANNYRHVAHVDEADVISGRVRHVGGYAGASAEAERASSLTGPAAASAEARSQQRGIGDNGYLSSAPLEVAYDNMYDYSPFMTPYDMADKGTAHDHAMFGDLPYGVYLDGVISAVPSTCSSRRQSYATYGNSSAPPVHCTSGSISTVVGGGGGGGAHSRQLTSALRPFLDPSGGSESQPLIMLGPRHGSSYGSLRTSIDMTSASASAVRSRPAAPAPSPCAWGSGSVSAAAAAAAATVGSASGVPAWATALAAHPHTAVLGSAPAEAHPGGRGRSPSPSSVAAGIAAGAATAGVAANLSERATVRSAPGQVPTSPLQRVSPRGPQTIATALTTAAPPGRPPSSVPAPAAAVAAAATSVNARRPRAQSHWYWAPPADTYHAAAAGPGSAVGHGGSSHGRAASIDGGSCFDGGPSAPLHTIQEETNLLLTLTQITAADRPSSSGVTDDEPSFGPVSPGLAALLRGAQGGGQGQGQVQSVPGGCEGSGRSRRPGQPASSLHRAASLPDLQSRSRSSRLTSAQLPAPAAATAAEAMPVVGPTRGPAASATATADSPGHAWTPAETVSGAAATAAAAAALRRRPMLTAAAAAAMAAAAAPPPSPTVLPPPTGSPDGPAAAAAIPPVTPAPESTPPPPSACCPGGAAVGARVHRRSLDDQWVEWALGRGLHADTDVPTADSAGGVKTAPPAAAAGAARRTSADVADAAPVPASPPSTAAAGDCPAVAAQPRHAARPLPSPPLPPASQQQQSTGSSATAASTTSSDTGGFTFTRPHPTTSATQRPRLHHHYRLVGFAAAPDAHPSAQHTALITSSGRAAAAAAVAAAASGSSSGAAAAAANGLWGWSRAGTACGTVAM